MKTDPFTLITIFQGGFLLLILGMAMILTVSFDIFFFLVLSPVVLLVSTAFSYKTRCLVVSTWSLLVYTTLSFLL